MGRGAARVTRNIYHSAAQFTQHPIPTKAHTIGISGPAMLGGARGERASGGLGCKQKPPNTLIWRGALRQAGALPCGAARAARRELAECPLCGKTVRCAPIDVREGAPSAEPCLDALNHKCTASPLARRQLAAQLGKLVAAPLPAVVCSACRRPIVLERVRDPRWEGAPLRGRARIVSDIAYINARGGEVVSTPEFGTCCEFDAPVHPEMTHCEKCDRIVDIAFVKTEPAERGEGRGAERGAGRGAGAKRAKRVERSALCGRCAPSGGGPCGKKGPLRAERAERAERGAGPGAGGSAVCFACHAIGDWEFYNPVPSEHLIQRYHRIKRRGCRLCTRCVRECRFCGQSALGEERTCTACARRPLSTQC